MLWPGLKELIKTIQLHRFEKTLPLLAASFVLFRGWGHCGFHLKTPHMKWGIIRNEGI